MSNKHTYIGTFDGLTKFIDNLTLPIQLLPSQTIHDIEYSDLNQLLLASTDAGIFSISSVDETVTHFVPNDNNCRGISIDGSRAYIATVGGGVAIIDGLDNPSTASVSSISPSISLNCYDVAYDGSFIYIATDNGLSKFDRFTLVEVSTHLVGNSCSSLTQDDNTLYIGTSNNISTFDKVIELTNTHQSMQINHIELDGDLLFISTPSGMFTLSIIDLDGTPDQRTPSVQCMHTSIDSEGVVWVSTDNGVLFGSRSSLTFNSSLTQADGLASDIVLSSLSIIAPLEPPLASIDTLSSINEGIHQNNDLSEKALHIGQLLIGSQYPRLVTRQDFSELFSLSDDIVAIQSSIADIISIISTQSSRLDGHDTDIININDDIGDIQSTINSVILPDIDDLQVRVTNIENRGSAVVDIVEIEDASHLSVGKVVRWDSALSVDLASNDNSVSRLYDAIGIVTNIEAGTLPADPDIVTISKFGNSGINASSSTGDIMYLSSNGDITSTLPTAPNTAIVELGTVNSLGNIDIRIRVVGIN